MELLRPGDERDIFAAKYEVEKQDVLNFKNFYKHMHEWLEDEGFVDPEGMKDKFESFYFEKLTTSGLKEHRIWWRCVFIPGESSYVRYVLKIDFQNLAMKDTEIMHHGQKFKTNSVDAVVRVEAWVQLDYQDQWQKHWFLKHFDSFFRRRIFHERWEEHKRELYKKAYNFQKRMKQFLEQKTYEPMPKIFRHKRGV